MGFISELKRRNVFKVGVAYIIIAWLLIQVTDIVAPALHLPDWTLTFLVYFLIIGFPLALFFAWAFELTPEGIKATSPVASRNIIEPVLAADKHGDAGVTSIAVMPFVDMSPNKDQEYLSDGLSEELLNKLARLEDLLVAGRTSSFAFKGRNEDLRVIGETLGVKYILEGSVRKSEDKVRITAQLIKVADGYHVWSETYDRALADIFAIQDEIAEAVATALSITLGVGELGKMEGGTRNLKAYEEYLLGRNLYAQMTPESAQNGVNHLTHAVEIDPGFAQAWAELVRFHTEMELSSGDRDAKDAIAIQQALERARELAPDLPQILNGLVNQHIDAGNYLAAEELIRNAMEKCCASDVDTTLAYAQFLRNVGRATEAIPYFKRVRRLDPIRNIYGLFLCYGSLGRYADAIAEIESQIPLPNAPAYMHQAAALSESLAAGDRTAVDKWLGLAIERGLRDDPSTIIKELIDTPEAALERLHQMYTDTEYSSPIDRMAISQWAAYFEDYEFSLEVLRNISVDNNTLLFQIWRSNYREVRKLPGFKDMVRNLGLVDYWRATGNWGDFCRPVGDDDFECI